MLEKRFEMVKEHHKKTFEDAAINGKMDPQLVSLCRFIASTKQFFTSSSCSGRIVLLKVNAEESKQESAFHRKWHSTVSADEVWNALEEKTKHERWLKQEPLILHIGAESIEGAKKILEIMRKCGIKRGGIMVAKKGKFLLEIVGTQRMSLPVKKDDKILISRGHLEFVVEKANRKLEKNYGTLGKFEETCRKKLS